MHLLNALKLDCNFIIKLIIIIIFIFNKVLIQNKTLSTLHMSAKSLAYHNRS